MPNPRISGHSLSGDGWCPASPAVEVTATWARIDASSGSTASDWSGGQDAGREREQPAAEVPHLFGRHQDEEGGQERADQVQGEPPPDRGAEEDGTPALEPPQVELAPAVDAVEGVGEAGVGPEERVAGGELAGAGQVGHLQLVPGDRVAEVADPQVAVPAHLVQQFGHELVPGDFLDPVRRPEPALPRGRP